MVKQLTQRDLYKDHECTLKELRTLLPKNIKGDISGDVVVQTKSGIPIKLVFV